MADKRSEGADDSLSNSIDRLRPSTQLNGRVTLPGAFVKAKSVTYGQPIVVEVTGNGMTVIKTPVGCSSSSMLGSSSSSAGPDDGGGVLCYTGVHQTYLCSATVATTSSSKLSFDPSLLCGLVASRQLDQEQQQLECSVRPITKDIITAATLKVLVPQQLLLSTVPAAKFQQRLVQKHCTLFLNSVVCCQVLDVTPAAPAGSVYRVVPSTNIQLTADTSKALSSGGLRPFDVNADGTTPPRPPSSSVISSNRPASAVASSSSSSSKKKKKTASKSSQGTPGKAASSTASTSKGKSKSECAADDNSEPPAVASGSMFDLLEGLEDL